MDSSQPNQGEVKNSVLIIDDLQSNLEILRTILKPDYTVYMANSGCAAVDIVNNVYPDLILLDIVMPDLNGFEVLKILKSDNKTKNIPVIIISGLEDAESEENGLDLGAADFIHKPFNAKIIKLKARHQMQIVNQIRAIEQYAHDEELAISKMLRLQNELELSIDNAQTANKAKSTFLARMSHEIRTPLNAVIGISEMQLQNQNIPPEIKEAFIRINNSGDLLLNIINDILDISKIEAGKLELTQYKYNVSKMINDTVYLNTIKHEDVPIEFILNVDENVPSELYGDEIRIKQILNNLLSNAFKYTQAGEVELSLKTEKTGNDQIVLIFTVRDTGQGMTEDQLARIFDEYARFNLDTNKAITGTGLGMSITNSLIRMMAGEIKAKSKRNSGSVFTVRIPQGDVKAKPLGKEAADKLRQFRGNFLEKYNNIQISREPIPFGKVLIVDDIDMNLFVTRGLLSPYGLQVDTAISGAEAVKKIKYSQSIKNLYDLVFMDHIMPVMDGIETTKKIRELGAEYEKLPIIMLTANAFSETKNTLTENGFNGFLLKPVCVQELDAVLKKWISPRRALQDNPKEINKTEDAGKTEKKTKEAQNEFFEVLGTIKEIDIKTGLANVAGNKDIYRNTLEIFLERLESEYGKISGFLGNKDLSNFFISIHSMKTMLAIIGASQLSETAHTLQIASSNQDIDYCKSGFEDFKNKLLVLKDKLADLFSKNSGSSVALQTEMNCKVLIVEDTEMILNVLKFVFEECGLHADTAASGAEAIEKTAHNQYDIIFLDYHMPEMDGIETAAHIRKQETEGKTPKKIIIALTEDMDSGKKKIFTDNGFDGFLSKPVNPDELEKILKQYSSR